MNRASERGVRETLHELESLSGRLEFALGKHGSCRPEIRVVPFPEEEYETDDFGPEHPQTREGKEFELLRIGASVPDPHEDKWERVDYLMSVGARFTKQVHDLALAANIARVPSR